MNRWLIRGLGIASGILLATIFSLVIRPGFRNLKSSANQAAVDEVAPTVDPTREDNVPEAKPDPGRRNALQSLVQSAKDEPSWLKEFELTERSGKTIRSEELRGQPYIACFFFTTCPGSCKRQSDQMRLLLAKFKDKPIRFVSITVDPDIDTPEVLSEYAETYTNEKERWLFLTGPLSYIVRVGTEKFFLDGVERRGHPDRFCLVNADGQVVGSYLWLKKEERELLIEHANELLAK